MPTTDRSRCALVTAILATTALALMSGGGIAAAQNAASSTAGASSERQARTVVARMVKTYKGLRSFSAKIEDDLKVGDQLLSCRSKVFLQNGKVRSESTVARDTLTYIFDGATLYTTNLETPTVYVKTKPAKAIGGQIQALGPSPELGGMLATLLFTPDQFSALVSRSDATVALAPKREMLNGTAVQVVTVEIPQRRVRLYIGAADNLMRRITITGTSSSQKLGTLKEIFSDLHANPTLDPALFHFTPPPGAVAMTEADLEQQTASYDPRLKVGAAPLPFSGTDTAGRPVSLAQYRGRVVLLDFWATWCPSCREELPNVVSVYNRYHRQGFDVIGISLDRKNDGPKLASFTAEHQMPWRQIYDGGYWKAKLATTYGVNAIPFAVLIGKNGKIAAVDVHGDSLERAVKLALAR